jgi:VWFA-related protein
MIRSFRRVASLAVLVVLLGGLSGTAQEPAPQNPPPAAPSPQDQPAADQQPPVFRGGINFVRVDAIVTDREGRPVLDLRPEDFEITEDDAAQTIETFKLIELDGGLLGTDGPPRAIRTDADEETEAGRDDVRLFAIFLDDYHVGETAGLSARESIARFIETQLGPSDMLGVMYPLQPISAVRFTRDHAAVMRTIQQFRGRKFRYQPENQFEETYANYPTEVVERIRNQVSLSALKALMHRMGGLKEGRKALVLVSEGYSNILPPQLRSPVAGFAGFDNPNQRDPFAGGGLIEERAAFLADTDLQIDLREVYGTANRNNVAIYPVDPRRLTATAFEISDNIGSQTDRAYLAATIDTLRTLSEGSDGRAIVSRNDITLAMKQIVLDSSAYYLLGYSSSAAPSDGRFHEIRVRVRRPGVQVRARPGYWAVTSEDLSRVTAAAAASEPPSAFETALAAIAPPPRSRLIRTWIGTGRGDQGKTRITLVWEPLPPTPGEVVRESDRPARVVVTATGEDGSPYFRGRVPAEATGPSTGGRVVFEAPPGPVQLRLSVEGEGAEVLDSETREVAIPDLTTADAVFGTPEIFRARTVRDLQELKANAQAVPTAAREFSRTERLLIRVPTFGSAAGAPLEARLLNRSGDPLSPLTVAAGDVPYVELQLAGLAVGEYFVEIAVSGSSAHPPQLVAFRVAS